MAARSRSGPFASSFAGFRGRAGVVRPRGARPRLGAGKGDTGLGLWYEGLFLRFAPTPAPIKHTGPYLSSLPVFPERPRAARPPSRGCGGSPCSALSLPLKLRAQASLAAAPHAGSCGPIRAVPSAPCRALGAAGPAASSGVAELQGSASRRGCSYRWWASYLAADGSFS
jgi:hypothetical protein